MVSSVRPIEGSTIFSLAPRLRLLAPMHIALAALFIVLALGPASSQQTPDFKLAAEDVIQIDVMGHPELSGEFLIPDDGKISLQRGGQIEVTGKTLHETSDLVISALKGTLLDPDVAVRLKSARPQWIHVIGSVQKPGSYATKPGWRITEAISAAGGTLPSVEVADCKVSVLPAGGAAKETMSLVDVMRGSGQANRIVQPGDVITVESVEMIPVYVIGRVAKPGAYSMRKDSAGVLEAVAIAGGTTDDAALSKVTVTHLTGQTETVSILLAMQDGKQKNSIKLVSGDLIVVPPSNDRFAVLGWVNSQGVFSMKEGETITLSDAIGMAKGADNRRGGLTKVAVIRQVDGKEQHQIYDLTRFNKSGDVSQNPVIKPQDIVWVPETNKTDWDKTLQAVSTAVGALWTFHSLH